MSSYYKPNRNPAWNYGGPNWRLSRSKIDLFMQCPRCFYADNKLGVARPPGFPFNLNTAVDHLLKEFDIHRKGKTAHPLMSHYGVDAIPYNHPDIDIWRENFKGLAVHPKPTGFTISGAIDDVWINTAEELIVVDYKSTSKDEITSLDQDWQDGYKRQMEIYQWILRKMGFTVSSTGYFVYANGQKDRKAFDGKLEFDITLIPYVGNDSWVDGVLLNIQKTLESTTVPLAGSDCDYCRYRGAVRELGIENELAG